MTPRREALVFTCAALALWALFFVQAWNTPILLDDWYQLTWHRNHDFGLSSIWEYGHYNYFHFNPRIGDVLLMIINGPPAYHLVLTPLVQVGLLWVAFAVCFGRWPRPTVRDLQILLFIQVMIWLVIPIPGIVYFYRPFATNYLWAFAITLALFVPYRLALASGDDKSRQWLAPAMLVLGWVAGMCNEHTGPTAMVVMAALIVWAWRKHRLRVWMLAGAVGLYVGYPMLFFAPGQALRYAGMAVKNTPLNLLAERGLDGTFEILLDFIGESQVGINLFLVGVLVYLGSYVRRRERPPPLPRATLMTASALVLASGAIVVTLFASPTVGERLFFAPAVLLVGACAVFAAHIFERASARRVVVAICVVAIAYHAVRFISVYRSAMRDNRTRLAILRDAKPDTVAIVPPYKKWKRTRWYWGDDFQYASLREYVANEVFDLHNIEYDRIIHWAEPSPPARYVATRTYDPPMPPELASKVAPVRYIPSFWEWTLVQFRRMMALRNLGSYKGHRLIGYTVDVTGSAFVDPKHRPFRVIEWTPERQQFVDGRPYDDRFGRPYIRVWQESLPARVDAAYVVGCGRQWQVEMVPDLDDNIGPMLPVTLDCRGTYTAVLCEPDICWFSGRYWR